MSIDVSNVFTCQLISEFRRCCSHPANMSCLVIKTLSDERFQDEILDHGCRKVSRMEIQQKAKEIAECAGRSLETYIRDWTERQIWALFYRLYAYILYGNAKDEPAYHKRLHDVYESIVGDILHMNDGEKKADLIFRIAIDAGHYSDDVKVERALESILLQTTSG